jgi:hypothetical protein
MFFIEFGCEIDRLNFRTMGSVHEHRAHERNLAKATALARDLGVSMPTVKSWAVVLAAS